MDMSISVSYSVVKSTCKSYFSKNKDIELNYYSGKSESLL